MASGWLLISAGLAAFVLLWLEHMIRQRRERSAKSEALARIRPPKADPHVPLPEFVEKTWFYRGEDGAAYGPVGREGLAALFDLGELTRGTLVLAEDGSDWTPLQKVFILPRRRPGAPFWGRLARSANSYDQNYYSHRYNGREWALRL